MSSIQAEHSSHTGLVSHAGGALVNFMQVGFAMLETGSVRYVVITPRGDARNGLGAAFATSLTTAAFATATTATTAASVAAAAAAAAAASLVC